MEPLASLNGVRQPLSEVRVSALDRGFLFGDGVYEVVRVYDGAPFLFEPHWSRLARSLDNLRLDPVDLEAFGRECLELVAAAGFREATLYAQITRGASSIRAHAFGDSIPTLFAYVSPADDALAPYRQTGAVAILEPDRRWGRCDIKSLNLLANTLAAQVAKERGAQEAIFFDRSGWITEGSRTNVFGVWGSRLRTMPLGPAILPGVTRAAVIELARELGIPVEERPFNTDELATASELFVTGTGSEVLPIVRLESRVVGGGVPGPVTRRLQQAYTRRIRAESSPSGPRD